MRRTVLTWIPFFRKPALTVSLFIALALLPTAVFAEVELAIMAGYRGGAPTLDLPPIFCITTPCPSQGEVDGRDGEAFGLILDVPLNNNGLMFEVLLNHQAGEYEPYDPGFIDYVFPFEPEPADFDLTYFHLGLARHWRKQRVTPFAAVGFGIAHIESSPDFFFFVPAVDDDRLSASVAGGAKIDLNQWLGVRLEGRGYWTDMPETFTSDLFQLEASTGLFFRF